MKNNKLKIIIQKSVQEVFAFTVNPNNTPKWIDGVVVEKTNEWPPSIGTIYENCDDKNNFSIYRVTKFEMNKEFELTKQDESTYVVNYFYRAVPDNSTELVYHEWVSEGVIENPFTQEMLEQLKKVMEK